MNGDDENNPPEDLIAAMGKSITNVASKMDVLFYDKINSKEHAELIQDVIALGGLYESYYKEVPTVLANALRRLDSSKADKGTRKKTGSFFTPVCIAEFIVRQTIGPLIEKIEKNKRIKDKVAKIGELKICDPACGGGIFLVVAHDFVIEKMLEANAMQDKKRADSEIYKMAVNCIYGVDINPNAIEGSKTVLHLNLMKWNLKSTLKENASIVEKLSS